MDGIFLVGVSLKMVRNEKLSLMAAAVSPFPKWEKFVFKKQKKPLIRWLKFDFKIRLVGSICLCTWINLETGEQKPFNKHISPSFLNSFKDEKQG